MKLVAAIIMIITLLPSLAPAQPLPQPKPNGPSGSSLHGYALSGTFREVTKLKAGQYDPCKLVIA